MQNENRLQHFSAKDPVSGLCAKMDDFVQIWSGPVQIWYVFVQIWYKSERARLIKLKHRIIIIRKLPLAEKYLGKREAR